MSRYRYRPPAKPLPVTRANYPQATEIFEAGFTTWVRNGLIRNYVWDLDHAEMASAEQLLDFRGFGRQSVFDFGIRMRELDRVVNPDIFDWMTIVEQRKNR